MQILAKSIILSIENKLSGDKLILQKELNPARKDKSTGKTRLSTDNQILWIISLFPESI